MGIHRMGPPETLILALRERSGLGDFIETGTYRGDTAAWAARHFPRVTTIELSPSYRAAAQSRFQTEPNVRVLGGTSDAVLCEVVPALTGPALFWLDAHWSGIDTAGREAECPLLGEIEAIDAAEHTHTILVDDARLFCTPPPSPHRADQWPDLALTVAALHAGGRRHVLMFDDVFVAVPASDHEFLNTWVQREISTATTSEGGFARWWKEIRR